MRKLREWISVLFLGEFVRSWQIHVPYQYHQLQRVRKTRISMTLSSSDEYNDDDSFHQLLKSIKGKTLLSVSECLNIFQSSQVFQESNDEESDESKVVFIDGSWWHKGDLNGREL